MIENKSNVYQRLISHMKINKTTGCWEWQGSKRNGYGRMIIGSRTDGTRKTVSTHRLSYELHYGEIPQGMEICHKCDNPCCINPDHLFAGTRQDNVDDRERKGRNNPPKGEKHAKAKLTELDVLTIRKRDCRVCLLANWQKNMEFAKRPFKMPLVERPGLICQIRRKENNYGTAL